MSGAAAGDRTEPPDFADLMSRGDLVGDIEKAVREAPLVTVGGISGAGKTYAASEYVRDKRRDSQVVLWHEAGPNELVDDLLVVLGRSVGLKASSTSARIQELCAALRHSDVLVVIDDFQNVNFESYRPLINLILILRLPPPAKLLVITQRDTIMARERATGSGRAVLRRRGEALYRPSTPGRYVGSNDRVAYD